MNTIDTQILDRGLFPGSDFEPTRWDRFVLRHTNPLNLWVHFLSMLMYFVGPVLVLVTGNLWWWAAPILAGSVGAFGHWISADGGVSIREATIEMTVPLYVPLVFWKIMMGSYFTEDIPKARAKARYNTAPKY